MFGAATTFLAICLASAVVGQAILGISGRRRWSWLAVPVGIAALIVVAGIAIRLPGRDLTALMALGAVTIGAAAYLLRTGNAAGWRSAVRIGLPIVVTVAAITALPFAINGNVGVLGVGYVNDDMSSHLQIAAYTADPGSGEPPTFVKGGYPVGPHALVAALALGLNTGLVESFAGLTLALAALTALTALAVLGGFGRWRQALIAGMVALSYLGASFLFQGAFKEPLQALIVIGFVLLLARMVGVGGGADEAGDDVAAEAELPAGSIHPIFRVAPLGVLAAGSVFNYSLPGLIWLGAITLTLLATTFLLSGSRLELPKGWLRRAAPYLGGALLIVALATLQEIGRISDFARLEALNPDRSGSDLGNLRQAISPLEALGVWPSGEFRLSASEASLSTAAFYLGGLLAAVGLAIGLFDARRRDRLALPAALAATAIVWGLTALFSTPYIAAKALAIGAPIVMLIVLPSLLRPGSGSFRSLVAVALVPAAMGSSFLAMRQTPVGPEAHAGELGQIRPLVEGSDVLFLGRDDFIGWELRGAQVTGVVENFFNVEELRGRFAKGEGGGEKFDFDAVLPSVMNDFDFVLTTNGGPLSSPPPRLKPIEVTENYTLWERPGPVGRRNTLNEGIEPGQVARCQGGDRNPALRGQGTATIWPVPPVYASEADWTDDATVGPGDPANATLDLTRGRWLISLEYDSRRPLTVRAGFNERIPDPDSPTVTLAKPLSTEIDANLDFRGPSPYFPVGEVELSRAGKLRVLVEATDGNFLARLLGAPSEGHLRSLSATPLDGTFARVQRRKACGAYVDWYRAR